MIKNLFRKIYLWQVLINFQYFSSYHFCIAQFILTINNCFAILKIFLKAIVGYSNVQCFCNSNVWYVYCEIRMYFRFHFSSYEYVARILIDKTRKNSSFLIAVSSSTSAVEIIFSFNVECVSPTFSFLFLIVSGFGLPFNLSLGEIFSLLLICESAHLVKFQISVIL